MKFSIRDLFLVTLIVALAVGWWVDRSRLAAELWQLRDDYSGYKLMPDGTVIAPDGEVTPPRIWEDTHMERYESSYPHEKTQGIDPPVDGHKETFTWPEATGQRVRVEGIAWGSLEKGLGEYVMMNEANIYVAKGEFLAKGVYGRMVRVSGVLRLRDVGGNPPTRIFIIEEAVVRPIEKVKWPWMAREPVAKEAPSDLAQQTDNRQQEKSLLEGDWILASATYGTSGLVQYTFRRDRLTITNSGGIDKFTGAPRATEVEEWAVEIDESQSPPRLTMKSIVPGGERPFLSKYAFRFKEGELWLLADDGEPITAASFDPGGNEGRWLSGLRRKE